MLLQAVRPRSLICFHGVESCAVGGYCGKAEALIAPHCLLCTSTIGCSSQNRETLQPLVSSSLEPGMLE